MTNITTALAAVLFASAGFANSAFAAEGEYYEGVRKDPVVQSRPIVSPEYTGSISGTVGTSQRVSGNSVLNSGDYYEGAVRPN